MISATITRLEPLFRLLNEEDAREDSGHAARVPEDVRTELWIWYYRLEDLDADLKNLGHRFHNSEWRKLKGALKQIGKVSFTGLAHRLPDICMELADLKITLP